MLDRASAREVCQLPLEGRILQSVAAAQILLRQRCILLLPGESLLAFLLLAKCAALENRARQIAQLLARGYEEGSIASPGDFVLERAFVEK